MPDVIADARKMYAERVPWWSLGLIHDLEGRCDGLGYEWVERCVRTLLPDIESGNKAELLADLNALSRYRSRPASPEEFSRKSREIWYRPNRDRAQTALSHLYGLAAQRHQPEVG